MNQRIPRLKDYMSPAPIVIGAEKSLEETEKLMSDNNLHLAPVMNFKGVFMGVVTEFNLAKCFVKKEKQTPAKPFIGNYVSELDPIIVLDENDMVTLAYQKMLEVPHQHIFVTSKGQLAGVFTPQDILYFLRGKVVDRSGSKLAAKAPEAPNGNPLAKAENPDAALLRKIDELKIELEMAKSELFDYKTFFLNAPYFMHSVGFDGTILMANRLLHFALGYDEGELIGKPVSTIYPSQNHREAEKGLLRIKTYGFHPPVNVLLVQKDQELVKADVVTMVRRNEKGIPIGTITVGQLSNQARMAEILPRAAYMFNQNFAAKDEPAKS